jgi:YhfH-like protein
MFIQDSIEFSRDLFVNHCPECGERMEVQVEAYLMECDRCLSKRDE